MTAILPLNVAAFAACIGHAELAAKVTGIHDGEAPQGSPTPYIVIGEDTEVPFGFFGQAGNENTVMFHIWSSYPGKKECLEILALLDEALRPDLVVAGHGTVRLRREFASTLVGEDRRRHLPARYRALALEG